MILKRHARTIKKGWSYQGKLTYMIAYEDGDKEVIYGNALDEIIVDDES